MQTEKPHRPHGTLRPLWPAPDAHAVDILDQTALPHARRTIRLTTLEDAAHAIRSMQVRGAPLIGATAAYGLALALQADASDGALAHAIDPLARQRPTVVDMRYPNGFALRVAAAPVIESKGKP